MKRIVGVKRIDKRRMEELREEVDVKEFQASERKNRRGTVDEETTRLRVGG